MFNRDRLHSTAIPFPGSGGGVTSDASTVPPPVPPRPNQTRPIYSTYNRGSMMPYSYSSPYSSYGYGYSSPYSPMGYGYGAGTGGYYGGNRPYYDNGAPGEPSFSQLAEESSASAFQSIESFVSAFGSISMMLESTFHALYSSFRAVVGVADHLGRVKQVFSALAIFRFFKWTWRRILYLIGISKIKPETVESLWSEAAERLQEGFGEFPLEDVPKPSSWPILMFLGFIFAGPYLMWKLVKSLNLDGSQSPEKSRKWASGDAEHFVAEVKYQFDATSDRELNLKSGQTIRLAPAKSQPKDVRGWALASDGSRIGLVPLNYIKVLGKRSRPLEREHALGSVFETPPSRPRVRFDLNPRPATTESVPETATKSSEPTGILVKNDKAIDAVEM